MCAKIDKNFIQHAIGCFMKGNEPAPIRMPILISPCACGMTFWARLKNGIVWVEVIQEENRHVDEATAKEFSRDVERAGAAPEGSGPPPDAILGRA